jgi:hypothetical protein
LGRGPRDRFRRFGVLKVRLFTFDKQAPAVVTNNVGGITAEINSSNG